MVDELPIELDANRRLRDWQAAKREETAMHIAEALMAQNMLDVACLVAVPVIASALAQGPQESTQLLSGADVETAMYDNRMLGRWDIEYDFEGIARDLNRIGTKR